MTTTLINFAETVLRVGVTALSGLVIPDASLAHAMPMRSAAVA